MEFTILFLATAIVMLTAWRGPRPLALGLFGAVLIACVATYLHHATDTRGQKQYGEFHRLVPAEKDAPVYDRFADLLTSNPVRQDQ